VHTSLSINLLNPVFDKVEPAFNEYGRVASEISKTLHNVINFVTGRFNTTNDYNLKINNHVVHERLKAHVDGGSLSVTIIEDKDCCEFAIKGKMKQVDVLGAFDSFIEYSRDEQLKKMVDFYRIFLIVLTTGVFQCEIKEESNTLKIQVGKYDDNHKPIYVLIDIRSN